MDIRKTVKKIAALVAGTTMVGATIMGAMALDLSDYPAPFVSDGVFDGKIVVGAVRPRIVPAVHHDPAEGEVNEVGGLERRPWPAVAKM